MPSRALSGSIMRSLSGESQQARDPSPIWYPSLSVVLPRDSLHFSPTFLGSLLGSGEDNGCNPEERAATGIYPSA